MKLSRHFARFLALSLLEVSLPTNETMKFVLVGAPEGDPGLDFNKY